MDAQHWFFSVLLRYTYFAMFAGGEVLEGEGAVWVLRVALPPQER
jgi:hypothetical protein